MAVAYHDTKPCACCRTQKPFSSFHKDKSKQDGLRTFCKECRKTGTKDYYARNRNALIAKECARYRQNKDKKREYDRMYRAANIGKVLLRAKLWSRANPDKRRRIVANYYMRHKSAIRRYHAERYAQNRERLLGRSKAWQKANRDAVRAAGNRRRARMMNAPGNYTANDIKRLYISQRGRCACCRASIAKGYHVDHIVPLARQGSNFSFNLQLLCPRCNLSKNAKDPIEFMQSRGFLL